MSENLGKGGTSRPDRDFSNSENTIHSTSYEGWETNPRMDVPKIAIVLPAYNEETTIRSVISDFHEHLPGASIYVVDNNSKDRTGEIAAETLREFSISGRVLRETRQGKGYAVRRAFHFIQADYYILADADLTYPGKHLAELLEPLLNDETDVVVGNRHATGAYKQENKRPLHNLGNRLVTWLINTCFSANLGDIMSGYRGFTRQFVKNYPILSSGFEIETDMTLHILDKRFRILEIPIEYRDRPPGSISKLNTMGDGARVLATIFKILRYYRPLAFFGWLAIAFCVLGLFVGAPVVYEFIEYQYVFAIPKAILATGLMLVSLISLSIGLILDNEARGNRAEYERVLLNQRN